MATSQPLRRPDRRWLLGYAMAAPAVILLVLFVVWPIGTAVGYSRFDASGYGDATPVGVGNYAQVVQDSELYRALARNLVFAAGVTFLSVLGGLLLAYSLYRKVPGWRFLQVALMVPNIIPLVVAGLLWQLMMDPGTGLINSSLRAVHLTALTSDWLSSPSTSLASVGIVHVWTIVPFAMLLLFAAMLGLPNEVIEAAKVDGCGDVRILIHIVLPMIRSSVVLVSLFVVVYLFRSIDLVWLLTKGGPLSSSTIATVYIYIQGFIEYRYGYANAVGLLLAAVLAGLAGAAAFIVSRRAHKAVGDNA